MRQRAAKDAPPPRLFIIVVVVCFWRNDLVLTPPRAGRSSRFCRALLLYARYLYFVVRGRGRKEDRAVTVTAAYHYCTPDFFWWGASFDTHAGGGGRRRMCGGGGGRGSLCCPPCLDDSTGSEYATSVRKTVGPVAKGLQDSVGLSFVSGGDGFW